MNRFDFVPSRLFGATTFQIVAMKRRNAARRQVDPSPCRCFVAGNLQFVAMYSLGGALKNYIATDDHLTVATHHPQQPLRHVGQGGKWCRATLKRLVAPEDVLIAPS